MCLKIAQINFQAHSLYTKYSPGGWEYPSEHRRIYEIIVRIIRL